MNKLLLKNLDKPLLIVTFSLFMIGLVSIYSATHSRGASPEVSSYVLKQMIWMALACAAFFAVICVDYQKLIDGAYVFYLLSLIMLALVLVIGRARLGAQRWISIGAFTLQPSEFVKIAFILALSAYLGYKARFSYQAKDMVVPALMMLPGFFLIFVQPDFGTAATLVPILLAMFFIRGVKVKHLLGLIGAGLAAIPLFLPFLKDYQRARLMVFINPDIDPLGAGYTVIQSRIAIGSGRIFGKGWLSGTQNTLNFLPERHTDFIFSVIGEEWGFIGSAIVIVLFAILIYRGLRIAAGTPDPYGKLLASGIVTLLAFQIVINIGMVMGFMPVVGLPLPLLSYGGSSLLATMISIGILLNIGVRKPRF